MILSAIALHAGRDERFAANPWARRRDRRQGPAEVADATSRLAHPGECIIEHTGDESTYAQLVDFLARISPTRPMAALKTTTTRMTRTFFHSSDTVMHTGPATIGKTIRILAVQTRNLLQAGGVWAAGVRSAPACSGRRTARVVE